MKIEKYEGKKFVVSIRGDRMRRRYVLSTIESNGNLLDQNEPFYVKEFERYYGFSPKWPHESVKKERDES